LGGQAKAKREIGTEPGCLEHGGPDLYRLKKKKLLTIREEVGLRKKKEGKRPKDKGGSLGEATQYYRSPLHGGLRARGGIY